jgi:hypothetical protein
MPIIDTSTSAEDLIARLPPQVRPAAPGRNQPTSVDPLSLDYINEQLDALYRSWGITPGGSGSGPIDKGYYAQKILDTGGWTDKTTKGENNIGYWTGRLQSDLTKGGYTLSSTPATSAPSATILGVPGAPDTLDTIGNTIPRQDYQDPNSPGEALQPYTPPTAPAAPAGRVQPPITDPGGSSAAKAALDAAARQRKKSQALGRHTTILGGFGSGHPSTRMATLLGY